MAGSAWFKIGVTKTTDPFARIAGGSHSQLTCRLTRTHGIIDKATSCVRAANRAVKRILHT
jgi:hypothetical protein